MPRSDSQAGQEVITRPKVLSREPAMYRVILLNDDYTTMDFVVMILQAVFKKNRDEAEQLMMSVHLSGSATAGAYTREVAETKIELVHHLATQHEYPLRCRMEPE